MTYRHTLFVFLFLTTSNLFAAVNPKTESAEEGLTKGVDDICAVQDEGYSSLIRIREFYKSMANRIVLSAVADEVKKQDADCPQVFAGKPIECSINIIAAKNCCGKDNDGRVEEVMFNCEDDERELVKAKEAGRAVEVGNGNNEYCYNKVLGICTSYHKVYCVFDSKIARIIQSEGRKKQLGISFGKVGNDYAYPNCRGITPEELSKLKIDQIDFSELYTEIKKKAESSLLADE